MLVLAKGAIIYIIALVDGFVLISSKNVDNSMGEIKSTTKT